MARRKRKTARRAATRRPAAVVKHRRRSTHYRRNPGGISGIVSQLTTGLMNAAEVTVGRIAARIVPALFKLPQGGAIGLAVQTGVGIAAGMAAEKVKRGSGAFVLAGALSAPVESIIKGLNLPVVSAALGELPGDYGYGEYADALDPGTVGTLSGYPAAGAGMGDYALAQQQM